MQARIRSIKDTYIASILNMDKLFAELQKVSTHPEEYELTQEHVKTITSEIKSKITSYGKMAIIDDLNNNYTHLVSNANLSALISWVTPSDKGDNGLISYANLFNKVRVKDKYVITFQVREVFGYLMYAYVNRKYIEHAKKVQLNAQLTSNCAIVYTRMIMRVIDSLFATSSIPVQSGAISYCIAKFFIRYVMCREIGKQLEHDICYTVAKRQADVTESSIVEFASRIPDEAYEDTKVFFATLAANFSTLNNMDINLIMRKFISAYGEKSLYMIELFPAFLGFTITSTYSSGLIKDYMFENVSGKEGAAIASNFLGLVQ